MCLLVLVRVWLPRGVHVSMAVVVEQLSAAVADEELEAREREKAEQLHEQQREEEDEEEDDEVVVPKKTVPGKFKVRE